MRKAALISLLTLIVMACATNAKAASGEYYYSLLSSDAKEFYSIILENKDKLRYNDEIVVDKTMSQDSANRYVEAMNNAVRAFNQDHPEVFWLRRSWNIQWNGRGSQITFSLRYAGVNDSWENGGRSIASDEDFLNNQILALTNEAKNSGDTQYDQLLYIHNWLTSHNLYNSWAFSIGQDNSGDNTPWEAISALDEDLSPVCEGYAKAFKLACDRLCIPCIIASGGNHAWNYVLMDDGNWYAVDVTYDDPIYTINGAEQNSLISGGEKQDYFLLGSQTFFANHTEDNEWEYPNLSKADYDVATAIHMEASYDFGPTEEIPAISEKGVNLTPETEGTEGFPAPNEGIEPTTQTEETFHATSNKSRDERGGIPAIFLIIFVIILIAGIGLVVAVVISRQRAAARRRRHWRGGGLL